jgi:hypothetical protein
MRKFILAPDEHGHDNLLIRRQILIAFAIAGKSRRPLPVYYSFHTVTMSGA